MVKITFMGAGSTVFVKSVIGDCMLRESLRDAEVALYDIDQIHNLCDDLIHAHGKWLPRFN